MDHRFSNHTLVGSLFDQLSEKFSRRNFVGQVLRGTFMRSVLGGKESVYIHKSWPIPKADGETLNHLGFRASPAPCQVQGKHGDGVMGRVSPDRTPKTT
jgi:hypothetical protein